MAPNLEKPEGQGLPPTLLSPILEGILEELRAIRDALAKTEMRMVGGSLLIVYESSWEKVKEALDRSQEEALEANVEDDVNGDDEDSDDDETSLPFAVKLIDFAHAKIVPGEGPDQGVLKGIDTTISLLEGRIKEVESDHEARR